VAGGILIRKLLICPYFGDFPPWYDAWYENARVLSPLGYDILIDTDEDVFRDRVRGILGVECPRMAGTGKSWDFRPTLGLLYEKELEGYDFWGHTDMDVVYGRIGRWVNDEFLQGLDMHSDCRSYVNGPWSLYRNTPMMRDLFTEEHFWQSILEDPVPSGWAEMQFSKIIEYSHQEGRLVKKWTQWQVFEESDLADLRLDDEGRLTLGPREVFMAHFRRTKVYPKGCIL
jgi:hypothetical protein